MFEIMHDVFCILIKSKNINDFCFQIITNQTTHDYLFQLHQQYKKKI